MTIVLVSGFLNHHQLSLCLELQKRCDKFYYIATDKITQERASLGYDDLNTTYDFVLRTYDGSVSAEKLRSVLVDSDVVIFGTCPDSYIEMRIKENKLSFIFSERFFKKGTWRRFIPTTRKKVMDRVGKYGGKNLYVLCASAFLPYDLSLCSFPTEKCLRWGYFPDADFHEKYQKRSNKKLKLLWAGRMVPFKYPNDAIYAVKFLEENNVDFQLSIVGEGVEKESLETLVEKLCLKDKVVFKGAMSPESVRQEMREADAFLVTSDFHEGWGAVVNEAMSEGCALLASSAIGSVPYLIEDRVNGLIYRFGDRKDMCEKLLLLAKDKELCSNLGMKAFETIKYEYCASVAAERLVSFAKNPETVNYERGPVSKAPLIKNKWY